MAYKVPVSITASIKATDEQIPSTDFNVLVQYDNSSPAAVYKPIDRIGLQPGYNLVVLSAVGRYSGLIQRDVEAYIDPTSATIGIDDSNCIYTGKSVEPTVTVKANGEQIRPTYPAKTLLFPSEDSPRITQSYGPYEAYRVSYNSNVNAGTATVVVSSQSTGTSINRAFEIQRRQMSDSHVQLCGFKDDLDFYGVDVQQDIVVGIDNYPINKSNYTITYLANNAFGQASCIVKGNDPNMAGQVTKPFAIWGNLSNANIDFTSQSYYTGQPINPQISVDLYGIPLAEGVHYTVNGSGSDYSSPGTKTKTIRGIEDAFIRKGSSKNYSYRVIGKISDAVIFGPSPSYEHTGSSIKPKFDVLFHDIWLSSGTDYQTSYPSQNYSTIGKKKIQIGGLGDYKLSNCVEYDIYGNGSSYQANTTLYFTDGHVQSLNVQQLTRASLGIDSSIDRTLVRVVVGSNVNALGPKLFSNCKMLTYVSLRSCSQDIELPEDCFDGCIRLQTVVFPGQTPSSGYTVKKYAYGNGGYIDTAYVPTNSTKTALSVHFSSQYSSSPCIGFTSEGILSINNDYRLTVPSQSSAVVRIGGRIWQYNRSSMFSPNTLHAIEFSKNGLKVDGNNIAGQQTNKSYLDKVLSHSICIFGQEQRLASNDVVQQVQIFEGSTLKMSLVPAVDSIGIGCLVDTLTGKKYYSQNGCDIMCRDDYDNTIYCFVEFDPSGGTVVPEIKRLQQGQQIGQLPAAEREGHTLSGWIDSSTGNIIDAKMVVATDMICLAQWLAQTKFVFAGGSVTYADIVGVFSKNTYTTYDPTGSGCRSVSLGDNVTSLAKGAFEATPIQSVYLTDKITSIPARAFEGCNSLEHVQLGDAVQSISSYAFHGCTHLSGISLPATVCSIGNHAFGGSGVTTADLQHLTSLTSIPDDAFYGCGSLSSLALPNTIARINDYAFGYCSQLTSIDLPDSIQYVGSGAFIGCSGLRQVNVPALVSFFGNNAFYRCTRLESVHVDGVDSWNSIEFKSASANPLAYAHMLYDSSTDDDQLVEYAKIYSNDGLSAVNPYLYYGCHSIKNAEINYGILSIGNEAFRDCSSLSSVILANTVSAIGNDAFNGCSSLADLQIDGKLRSIGSYAFADTGFTEMSLSSEHLSYIGIGAFASCRQLSSVCIDGNNLSILQNTFSNSSRLQKVVLGKGVVAYQQYRVIIGQKLAGVFTDCSALTHVVLPFAGVSISSCNKGVGYPFGEKSYAGSQLVSQGLDYYVPQALRHITLLDNESHCVPEKLFANFSMLSSIQLGDSISSIMQFAFYDCSGVQKIVIPHSVSSIARHAFAVNNKNYDTLLDRYLPLPSLTCLAFEGRTLEEVQQLDQYPWNLDESVISCGL